jgi:hypothetical protein
MYIYIYVYVYIYGYIHTYIKISYTHRNSSNNELNKKDKTSDNDNFSTNQTKIVMLNEVRIRRALSVSNIFKKNKTADVVDTSVDDGRSRKISGKIHCIY